MPRLESEHIRSLLAENLDDLWAKFDKLKSAKEQIRFLIDHRLGTIFYRETYPRYPEDDEPVACLLRTPFNMQDGREREDRFVLIEYQGTDNPNTSIFIVSDKQRINNIQGFYEEYFPAYQSKEFQIPKGVLVGDYFRWYNPEFLESDVQTFLYDALMTEIGFRNNNLRGFK